MARTLTRLSSTIALGILFCLAQPASPVGQRYALAAGLTAKDTARARQARQLYKEGAYEDAAKLFSDLSSEHPDMLVFTRNLGACYYYLQRPEPALSNLREYLQRGLHVTSADRREVERWITEMEQLRSQHAASVAPPAPIPQAEPPQAPAVPSQPVTGPSPAEATPGTSATQLGTPTASVLEAVPASPAAVAVSSGRGLRIAGIVCGSFGLASVGTAIYFYTRATSLSDKVSSSDAPSASDFKSGKNAQTMQWMFYSLGATALATGTVLYYLGWRRDSAGPIATAVAPMVGPGLAGFAAQGAF